jgi:hypothetical protein
MVANYRAGKLNFKDIKNFDIATSFLTNAPKWRVRGAFLKIKKDRRKIPRPGHIIYRF